MITKPFFFEDVPKGSIITTTHVAETLDHLTGIVVEHCTLVLFGGWGNPHRIRGGWTRFFIMSPAEEQRLLESLADLARLHSQWNPNPFRIGNTVATISFARDNETLAHMRFHPSIKTFLQVCQVYREVKDAIEGRVR